MRHRFQKYFCSLCLLLASFLLPAQADYEWGSLPLGGGGFVSSIIAHPAEQGLFYARTDVGGIYRWNNASSTWIPITDQFGPADRGLFGIDGFCIDPSNPSRLYALAGLEYFSGGKTAILISEDYGQTFEVVEVTTKFKTHGNGEGRHTGEKLAVNPNNPDEILCGTRDNQGLFKSSDRGHTWTKVSSLTVSGCSTAGISFVAFDDVNQNCIYVGLSKTSNNIWKSIDGGNTWKDISKGNGLYPHRAYMTGGVLYVSFAADFQSNAQAHKGAVCKYDGNNWADLLTSNDHNFGGISVVGNRIVVSTTGSWWPQKWPTGNTNYGDYIFVSDNGGGSWTNLFGDNKITFDSNGNPWVVDHALHWCGSATLDPFNPKRAFFTSGNGVFCTENLSANAQVTLKFMTAGLEETVPLDLVAPLSGGLISAIGDYDGAVYVANAAGGFDTPNNVHTPEAGTTYAIDIAADGSLAMRAFKKSPYVQYSTNGGRSWQGVASEKGGTEYAENGGIAVSADGSVAVYCPAGQEKFFYTTNKGGSWNQCNNININGGYPVADRVNPQKFYAYNGANVFYSTDGGKNWAQGASVQNDGYSGYKIRAVPTIDGEVWIHAGKNGLYRSKDGGKTATKVANVAACSAVGFGKAAEGETFPAIFVWGVVDGVEGIFRSIDEAASWERINDDAHQFGGLGNSAAVLGDMQEFGRVYMGTAGRGVVYGKVSSVQCPSPKFNEKIISLCGKDSVELQSNTVENTNVTYAWYKDDVLIPDADKPSHFVTSAGVYRVVRDSLVCTRSAKVTVEGIPNLPVAVVHPCAAGGVAEMTVLAEGNAFAWYDAESAGNLLAEGAVFMPTIAENSTFYVQDMGGERHNFGPTTESTGWNSPDLTDATMKFAFSVKKPCTLATVDIDPTALGTLKVNVRNALTSEILHSKSFTLAKTGLQTFALGFDLSVGNYVIDMEGSNLDGDYGGVFFSNGGFALPMGVDGLITVSKHESSWSGNGGCFFNWTVSISNSCARTPVTAYVDDEVACPGVVPQTVTQTIALQAGWNLVSLYVEPSDNSVEAVLHGLDFSIVKNNEGFFKNGAAAELQSLADIQPGEGYLIYMNAAAALSVEGLPTEVSSTALSSGWNLVGVPRENSKPVSEMPATVTAVKDLTGTAVLHLEAGKAYFIHSSASAAIDWRE